MSRTATTDDELERALLCCLILRPQELKRCNVVADDFWLTIHQAIFTALQQVGELTDIAALRRQLIENGEEWDASYLAQISQASLTGYLAQGYANIVREMSQRRKVLRLNMEIKRRLKDPDIAVADTVEYARQQYGRPMR